MSHPSWVCGLKLIKKPITLSNLVSHPSWVCGLKQRRIEQVNLDWLVTPFVGVWIETALENDPKYFRGSHPSWVCGLKLILCQMICVKVSSHPSWVCGLKHLLQNLLEKLKSHTLRGCVD